MAEQIPPTSFDATSGQPLIGIPLEENGRQVVRYFADEDAADKAMAKPRQDGRHLAGAWKAIDPELDWDQLADELDRIRHESGPRPAIDVDL